MIYCLFEVSSKKNTYKPTAIKGYKAIFTKSLK